MMLAPADEPRAHRLRRGLRRAPGRLARRCGSRSGTVPERRGPERGRGAQRRSTGSSSWSRTTSQTEASDSVDEGQRHPHDRARRRRLAAPRRHGHARRLDAVPRCSPCPNVAGMTRDRGDRRARGAPGSRSTTRSGTPFPELAHPGDGHPRIPQRGEMHAQGRRVIAHSRSTGSRETRRRRMPRRGVSASRAPRPRGTRARGSACGSGAGRTATRSASRGWPRRSSPSRRGTR